MADEAKKGEKEKKEAEPAEEENPATDAKKRKKKLLIFAILGVLLIGASGGGAFMFLSGGTKTKDADQEVTAKGADEKAEEHGGAKKNDEAKKEEAHGKEKKGEDHGGAEKKPEEHGGADPKAAEQGGAEDPDKKNEITNEEKKEVKAQQDFDFGETIKLSNFNINLGNSLENRYVRIEISLEYKGGDVTKREIDRRMPQLRDSIIGILQRKTREFLLAPDGKEALRKEILTRINRYMKTKIEAVYITDMLIE